MGFAQANISDLMDQLAKEADFSNQLSAEVIKPAPTTTTTTTTLETDVLSFWFGKVRELDSYNFESAEAKQRFEQLMEQLKVQLMQQMVDQMSGAMLEP